MSKKSGHWVASLAVGGGIILVWQIAKAQRAELQRRFVVEQQRTLQEALLSAAHALETMAECFASDVRTGTLSPPEAIDKFLNESLGQVLGSTKPSLAMNLFKGRDAHWILMRRLLRSVTRLARQPGLSIGMTKYVDFKTGVIQSEMLRAPDDTKRFVVVSDTHMRHRDIEIPEGDVLIHCGDILNCGGDPAPATWNPWRLCLDEFIAWLNEQKQHCPEIVFIGGNHDAYLENMGAARLRELLPSHVTYLCESETCVAGGIRIYGTSFSYTQAKNKSENMAFQNGDPTEVSRIMDAVPEGIDILITHGPPQMDATPFDFKPPSWNNSSDFGVYGCDELARTVRERVRPRVHAFGHVHEAHGSHRIGETLYIAGSSVSTFKCTAENPPIVFDLPIARRDF